MLPNVLHGPVSFSKFAAGWLPALAVTAVVDPAPRLADAFAIDLGSGVVLPPVTAVLAIVGIAIARPFARKRESALSTPLFLLATLALLIGVELWVLEARPGAAFTFVMAFGVGFSGFTLLEIVGDQVTDVVRRVFSKNRGSEPDSGA